jgi:DNA (cytosine-5)-methyltransferase 1
MRLGLDQSGWHTLFANDIDEKKQEMYCHHFGPSPEFVLGDIHKIDQATVPSTLLATASFPCNDLSLAGARKGLAGEHSSAFWGFIRILKEMGTRRPPLVLLENVTGFLTSHEGSDFHEALLALNDLGYSVDAFIIDASRFVPQSRQRLFVVGQRNASLRVAETPRLLQSELRPAALADFILWHPDVQWSLRSLPLLPQRKTQLADIIEDLSPNAAAWWSKDRCDYLLNQMSPKHRANLMPRFFGVSARPVPWPSCEPMASPGAFAPRGEEAGGRFCLSREKDDSPCVSSRPVNAPVLWVLMNSVSKRRSIRPSSASAMPSAFP